MLIIRSALYAVKEGIQRPLLRHSGFDGAAVHGGQIGRRLRREGVCNDIIDLPVGRTEALLRIGILLLRGHLLRPPGDPLLPQAPVEGVPAAEGKQRTAADAVHLPAHQVDEVGAQSVDAPALPPFDGVLLQAGEILVVAVHEQDGVILPGHTIQKGFIRRTAPAPEAHSEVAAHDHRVAGAEHRLDLLRPLSLQAMGVPGHIDHVLPPFHLNHEPFMINYSNSIGLRQEIPPRRISCAGAVLFRSTQR